MTTVDIYIEGVEIGTVSRESPWHPKPSAGALRSAPGLTNVLM